MTWFSSNNPFLSIPSVSGSFTVQPLTHLCQRGFGRCYTNVNHLDDSLRTQTWSSERDPFTLSHGITLQQPRRAALSPPADPPSLLCPSLQGSAAFKWCLKGYSTAMRSTRDQVRPVQCSGEQEHEEAGQNMKDEVLLCLSERERGNRSGKQSGRCKRRGVRTR